MFFNFNKFFLAQRKFTMLIAVMVVVTLLSTISFAADKDDLLNAMQQNRIEDVKRFLKEGLDFKEIHINPCGLYEFPSYELGELALNNGLNSDNFLDAILVI